MYCKFIFKKVFVDYQELFGVLNFDLSLTGYSFSRQTDTVSADTFGPDTRSPYLVVVTRSLVRHVKNPERAGSLHAAPRAVTCREVVG